MPNSSVSHTLFADKAVHMKKGQSYARVCCFAPDARASRHIHSLPPNSHSLTDPPNQPYLSQAHFLLLQSFGGGEASAYKKEKCRKYTACFLRKLTTAQRLPCWLHQIQAAAGSAVSCCPHNMLAQTAGCQGLWRYAVVCACKISYTPCLDCIRSQALHTACRLMCLPASHLCADSQTRLPLTQRGNWCSSATQMLACSTTCLSYGDTHPLNPASSEW